MTSIAADLAALQRLAAQLEPTDSAAVAEALATCRRSLERLAQPVDQSQSTGALGWDDDDELLADFDLDGAVAAASQGASSSQPQLPSQPLVVGADGLVRDGEWHAIVTTDLQPGEMMKIRASAGAGKSTVLRDYTNGRRDFKCLYLTYNTEIADEKRQEFNAAGLHHVTVKTVSAVANGPTRRAGLIDSVSGELYLKSEHVLSVAARSANDEMLGAIKEVFAKFCASTDGSIGREHLPCTAAYITAELNDSEVISNSIHLWDAMYDPTRRKRHRLPPVTHEMYGKFFQLRPDLQAAAYAGFDLVMLDEAHDCTACQISYVFARAPCRMLVVFDAHQAVYGFRYAQGVAAIEAQPHVAERPLTQAWRYGAPLSIAAAQLVARFKGGWHAAFTIRGNPQRETRLLLADSGPPFEDVCVRRGEQLVVVVRYNRTTFDLALDALDRLSSAALADGPPRLYFPGGGLFSFLGARGEERILDIHKLCIGVKDKERYSKPDGFEARFAPGGGWIKYKEVLQKKNDITALLACDVVEKNKISFPAKLEKIKSATWDCAAQCHVRFTTTHKVKGLGFKHVYMASDFFGRGKTPNEFADAVWAAKVSQGESCPSPAELLQSPLELLRLDGQDAEEEVNLAYVSLTRAMEALYVGSVTAKWLELAGVRVEGRQAPPPLADDEPSDESVYLEQARLQRQVRAATAASSTAEEDEVVIEREVSLAERNAAGFANAIVLDSPVAPSAPSAPPAPSASVVVEEEENDDSDGDDAAADDDDGFIVDDGEDPDEDRDFEEGEGDDDDDDDDDDDSETDEDDVDGGPASAAAGASGENDAPNQAPPANNANGKRAAAAPAADPAPKRRSSSRVSSRSTKPAARKSKAPQAARD